MWEWTIEENEAFEKVLANIDFGNPYFIHEIALKVPTKTSEQIQEHLNALVSDVEMIDLGYFDDKLNYFYKPLRKKEGSTSNVCKVLPPRDFRRKAIPWTGDEHEAFLRGLQKYGKGDWKSISRHCVKTKTPTQVASHAQKYYLKVEKFAQQHDSYA